jgi:DNA-binding MarR family transcriptional regulator
MGFPEEDSFLPIQRILFALTKARNTLTADMHDALANTGITGSHVGALLLISFGLACSAVALSKMLSIDSGFASRMIDRLEQQGLVRRERGQADRRVVNLMVTDAGRHLAGRLAEIVPAVLNRRLSSFTPLEFSALCYLLEKLQND